MAFFYIRKPSKITGKNVRCPSAVIKKLSRCNVSKNAVGEKLCIDRRAKKLLADSSEFYFSRLNFVKSAIYFITSIINRCNHHSQFDWNRLKMRLLCDAINTEFKVESTMHDIYSGL